MSNQGDKREEETLITEATTMADSHDPQVEEQQHHHQQQQSHGIKNPEKISFSIWPPTQRTRDAVINRLVETLSAPSILSKRYGSMPVDEASSAARLVEEEAFATASGAHTIATDDGVEILQLYSKEISKGMLEAVKARSDSASPPENALQAPAAALATSEEISSVETESS